jgi:uncharacterized SAM-binding protein YcdF (DUF218 family)
LDHPRRRPPLKFVLIAAVVLLAGFFARSFWLPVFGYALVRDDGLAKADIIVVLAGGPGGERILKGAELVQQGYAPAALLSGSATFFGVREVDLMVPFLVRHGYPAQWFIPFSSESYSTREESAAILAELRRRGVHSFLLVTSDFHTARASRIFRSVERAAGGGPEFRTIPAPDPFFRPGAWWKNRESQKTFFEEWCKTVANVFGI